MSAKAMLRALVASLMLGAMSQQAQAERIVVGPKAIAADAILQAAEKQGLGAAIIVTKAGEVILQAGYGLAQRGSKRPFTVDTVAQVGSITKQFTAAAIADLALQGRLDLDAPVSRYLENVPPAVGEIKLAALLTHTAGLPDLCGDDFAEIDFSTWVAGCPADLSIRSPAGTFAYSNTGYSLLAAVAEAVSNQPLESYLRSRFFAPLGMNDTGYQFPGRVMADFAFGYEDDVERPPISERIAQLRRGYWNLYGNGGMQSSASDMMRWLKALNGAGTAISEEMRQALLTPHAWRDPGIGYGYGWFVRIDDESGQIRQISHAGSDGVFFSVALMWPQREILLYYVGNSGQEIGRDTLRAVLNALRD